MSKRVDKMTALEAIDTIVDAVEILSFLGLGEESDDDGMKACAEKYGMVGLPRDADDKPIHIGDLVAIGDDAFYVDELHLIEGGEIGCFWKVLRGDGEHFLPDALRHVSEDTVEGILLEAVHRAHCDTIASKGSTDVTDLLERLRDLM